MSTRKPSIGDRVEIVGMCCEGSADAVGVVTREKTGRFGTSWEITLPDGATEWASSIAPAGTLGAGYRFAGVA